MRTMQHYDLIVIGGGAAGFYGAIQAAELNPGLRVLILEKSGKLLSKVRVSGGGRCNVTHHCFDPVKLSRHYPRGGKLIRSVFRNYHARHTVDWFSSKGVRLKVEADGRMFPDTDSSETIIDCFLREARRLRIAIQVGAAVKQIDPLGSAFHVLTEAGAEYRCSRILMTTGGSPKLEAYSLIARLGHNIKPPIPSLFTFNDPERKFADLMGVSVPNAGVRIASTRFRQEGPLLITHWGLSGPAVIRLSAWAAEWLHSVNYSFTCLVSWIGPMDEEVLRSQLLSQKNERTKQKIYGNPLFGLPQRLWTRICTLAGIPPDKIWGEISQRHLNKLLEHILRCPFHIKGKTTFKEEFVTCGGVDLEEINPDTMESRIIKGLYFAGEVLNIDGETGGFNFQCAWSTAFLAAQSSFCDKT